MADEIPQTVSSRTVFEGRVFRVRLDDLRYADGATYRCDVVEHPGSIGVIPLTGDGEIVLVRQYRHPVERVLWEIPAGTAETGEDPRECALRELAEETGYRAERIAPLWTVYMTPGFCDEIMHFFLAQGLVPGEQSLDPDERIDVGIFDLAHALRMLAAGEIADVKTLLALQWLSAQRGEVGSGTVDRKN
jgi:ADP-ribose pyrophosphatase